MNEGWIVVSRKIMQCKWLDEKPVSKREAWLDMLLMAGWKDREINRGGKKEICPRGSFPASMRSLAKRWGWDKKKVQRFLKMTATQNATKVSPKLPRKCSIITICNYDQYQILPQQDGTASVPISVPNDGYKHNELKNKRIKEESEKTRSHPKSSLKNSHTKDAITHYVECFEARFGKRPVITTRDTGLLKNITRQVSIDELKQAISKFINSSDPWFLKRGYTLECFSQSINALQVDPKSKTKKEPLRVPKDDPRELLKNSGF